MTGETKNTPPSTPAEEDAAFEPAMSTQDFRVWGKHMVDYICDYLDNIGERRVIPDVEPGYLRPLMPEQAPENAEQWPEILKDVEDLIMPGITHWQHPRFHAYFPAGNSFPSIMGDMLSDALGTIGFSWAASPAMAELEIVVLDWLADLLGLPKAFTHEGTGGGALQGSASDCILLSMLAARHQAIEKHKKYFEQAGHANPETAILSRLVAYCSNLAHSSVEKAGLISFVQVRQLAVNEKFAIETDAMRMAIEEDIKQGFIPFYICATLGTTACCSFDDLKIIGPLAHQFGLWLHIDGAYGANSFICPEFRHHMEGIEFASSINFNPNKWLLTNFDCSVFWVADRGALTHSMVVNPVYLQHKYSSKAIDFRHWGIPLSRRFRALKLWFVIRKYGAKGLRAYIRNHVKLAKLFASLVESDDHFEIIGEVELGLVCFRIKGANALTQCLIRTINESRELHMVPAMVNELYIIRFAVCRESASEEDIRHAWSVTRGFAEEIIAAEACLRQWRVHTRENSIRKKRRAKAAATALQLGENGEIKEHDPVVNLATEKIDEEDEYDENASDDEDDAMSTDSSNIGDLETTDLGDEDIIQLATERLQDLHEQGAKEAYNVLAQQLRNLGVTDMKNYEELEEFDEAAAKPVDTNNNKDQEEEAKSPDTKPEMVVGSVEKPKLEEIDEAAKEDEEEEAGDDKDEDDSLADLSLKPRMGRFKSLSVAVAIKGYDRVLNDRRTSQPGHSEYLANSRENPKTPNNRSTTGDQQQWTTPDSSFLGLSAGEQCVVSSTPFSAASSAANGGVPIKSAVPPRQSICTTGKPSGESLGLGLTAPRRFSLNPEVSLNASGSNTGGSGGTPVVARLVSMVMNASGNGPMNLSYSRQHRPSLLSTSRSAVLDESTNAAKDPAVGLHLGNLSTASFDHAHLAAAAKPLNHTYSHGWRVGMNTEDDIDDVFVCDSDLCVGGLSKESTLTRLRRQTLLKMISDPVSYKNRRLFRSLREQRRMTAVSPDFEPRERAKSEYSRRPTVQVCENIHKVMENGNDELLHDFKRRNKSMIETSSSSFSSSDSGVKLTNRADRSMEKCGPLKATLRNENRIEEECEETE